jgi:hypothetical protein
MKKLYFLLVAMLVAAGTMQAQCTIDSSHVPTPGVYPAADSLPCIHAGVAYNQTVQGRIQTTKDTTISGFSVTIYVDTVRIDSIAGLPAGITWAKNPNILLGGGVGCVVFSGTTTAAAGQYPLTAFGMAKLHGSAAGQTFPYTINGNLNPYSSFGGYFLTVCTANSINEINSTLSDALEVYPNPNNGAFGIKLNTAEAVNGDLSIVDVTGRVVFTQRIETTGFYSTNVNLSHYAKGLYTLQLRTANGFAAKNISVE